MFNIVSFWWPQEVPANALRILRREEALVLREEMWGANEKGKEKCVSRVTPRIFGVFSRGIIALFTDMFG